MYISRQNLKALARTNVCEIKFRRRHPVIGRSLYRRMLCSTSPILLMSLDGRLTLNYRPTNNPPPYDPDKYNLVIVWDILMQNYRSVNMSYCNLIAKIPLNNKTSLTKFWDYFNKEIYPKSANEKKGWMDS
jgi:hypothetical protein